MLCSRKLEFPGERHNVIKKMCKLCSVELNLWCCEIAASLAAPLFCPSENISTVYVVKIEYLKWLISTCKIVSSVNSIRLVIFGTFKVPYGAMQSSCNLLNYSRYFNACNQLSFTYNINQNQLNQQNLRFSWCDSWPCLLFFFQHIPQLL